MVAVCFANDEDPGCWMVQHGWALVYRRYSHCYVSDEEAARAAGRGV
jgi:endonuclease YncB( thermonuclease family)